MAAPSAELQITLPPPRRARALVLLAILVPGFVITAAVGNIFLPADKRLPMDLLGHDFITFYTVGNQVRDGQSRELYVLPKFQARQDQLAARSGVPLKGQAPYFYPPFFALLFVPLTGLGFWTALGVWVAFNLTCFAAALWLLCRILREPDGIHRALTTAQCIALLLLIACSGPAIAALTHGQNTMMSLLLVTAAVSLVRDRRTLAAGLVGGLLFFKPQLGLTVAAALALVGGWRTVLGLGITGIGLLAINLIVLPGTLTDYRHLLPGNLSFYQVDQAYFWDRHATLRAFWRLLCQGHSTGPMHTGPLLAWLASCMAVAAIAARAWWQMRVAMTEDPTNNAPRDRFLATALLTMPLLMPFYFDYDLLLMGLVAALVARHWADLRGRWIASLALILYLAILGNAPLARWTGVNVAVIALAGLCAAVGWVPAWSRAGKLRVLGRECSGAVGVDGQRIAGRVGASPAANLRGA